MADRQALLAGRRPSVVPADQVDVSAADADRHRLDEDDAIGRRRRTSIFEPNRAAGARLDGERLHAEAERAKLSPFRSPLTASDQRSPSAVYMRHDRR